jgi:hypothetical protein
MKRKDWALEDTAERWRSSTEPFGADACRLKRPLILLINLLVNHLVFVEGVLMLLQSIHI